MELTMDKNRANSLQTRAARLTTLGDQIEQALAAGGPACRGISLTCDAAIYIVGVLRQVEREDQTKK